MEKPAQKLDYYAAIVSRQVKDPNDEKKTIWKEEKTQVIVNSTMNASLAVDAEMGKMGIIAKKKDGTPFTQQEMEELRKSFINYEQGALKVSQQTTVEEVNNSVVPVTVEMAEVKKQKTCYCDKDLTIDNLKSIVKKITGKEDIWKGLTEACEITDKSYETLTKEVNAMFRSYGINKCIQKISFLAQVSAETGMFQLSHEEKSKYASSMSVYKGRGLIQLTGVKADDKSEYYNEPGPYEDYANKVGNQEIVTNPDIVAKDVHYTVDSSGWEWSVHKKVPNWSTSSENEAIKWKADYFKDGLGKSLNELAIVMENIDEQKYFYLQAKILNGYGKNQKLEKDPHGWKTRKESFSKLKSWFKYNKNVCKNGGVIPEMTGGAPWLPFAIQEFSTYKGIRMTNSPLKERIYEYFDISSYPEGTNTTSWCAAFINWCFEQTDEYKDTNTKANVAAFDWLIPDKAKAQNDVLDGWPNGEMIDDVKDAFAGAVIVFSHSHVAFVVGQSNDEKSLIYLGGNQSDGAPDDGKGKRTICTNPISKDKINKNFWLIKPNNYFPSDDEKNLKKMSADGGELGYNDTH